MSNNNNTYEFIEQALSKITKNPDSGIPEHSIPHVIAVLRDHPDLSVRGTSTAMRQKLETIIDNLHKQGSFD